MIGGQFDEFLFCFMKIYKNFFRHYILWCIFYVNLDKINKLGEKMQKLFNKDVRYKDVKILIKIIIIYFKYNA